MTLHTIPIQNVCVKKARKSATATIAMVPQRIEYKSSFLIFWPTYVSHGCSLVNKLFRAKYLRDFPSGGFRWLKTQFSEMYVLLLFGLNKGTAPIQVWAACPLQPFSDLCRQKVTTFISGTEKIEQ